MSYVYKAYGYNSMGNERVEGDPSQLSLFLVSPGFTENRIEASGLLNGSSYQLIITGNFDISAPLITLADYRGFISTVTSYRNGLLSEYNEVNPSSGVNLVKFGTFVPEFYLGDDWFEGSSTNSLADAITGLSGNDVFIGYGSGEDGTPRDYFYGGDGVDTSVYRGRLADYRIELDQQIWDDRVADGSQTDGIYVTDTVQGRDGGDGLNSTERLRFSDVSLALDTGKGEIAGSAYRIYKAAFDRAPDAGGLGFWIDSMDAGASLTSVARGFIDSAEFQSVYGTNVSDRDYVTRLYKNVLDRNPDQGGYDFWLGAIARGASREDILISFSESAENIANVAELIAHGIQYQAWGV